MDEGKTRILVVDDEAQIGRMLIVALESHGFSVKVSISGSNAIADAALWHPDLILLDLGLPDMDGREVIKRFRAWLEVPIIVLSARTHESEKIAALDEGADDYLTKPFGMGELMARLRVALRHTQTQPKEPVLVFDKIKINLASREVFVGGAEIRLTPTEYEVLKLFARNSGKVLTQGQILRTVWGPDYDAETQYLRIYVSQLRKKIEANPSKPVHIQTEPGVGYRFV